MLYILLFVFVKKTSKLPLLYVVKLLGPWVADLQAWCQHAVSFYVPVYNAVMQAS